MAQVARSTAENVWARSAAACTRALGVLAAMTLFFMMCVTFADVVMRKVLPGTFPAADELTKLSLGVLVFASLPLVTARREQVVISLFEGFFSGLLNRLRLALVEFASAVLLAVLAWRLALIAQRFGDYSDTMLYLDIPIAPFAWFMFAMAVLASAIALGLAVSRQRAGGLSN